MSSWEATTLLLGEYSVEQEQNPVFTVADGLIWLSQSVHRNSIVRKMQIVKMRGQAVHPGMHTFRITQAGLRVFAPIDVAVAPVPARVPETDSTISSTATATATATAKPRLGMGIPGLDDMMGGGLPRGYSLLVGGPSGSGKSILAAAFLAEGAREGQTGVIAAFEQRPTRSRGRAMTELIESGCVGVVDTRDATLSVDEISTLLLASAGVTVLMTSELEDRYNDLRFSPYGTAFLTDAIIVQRYIEVDSRLQRVLAVVKVRASPHSDALRLFHIGEDGILIGGMLTETEGLLSGQPTRRSHADETESG